MESVSVFSILLALGLLMFLCFKKWPILVLAPLLSLFVASLSGLDLVKAIGTTYAAGVGGYVTKFFLIFLLGSIFGKYMEDSGAAEVIAHYIIKKIGAKGALLAAMSVVIIAAILTYGGVVVFVIIFAIAPIALPLFREADLPWEIFPGLLAFGGATFTMSMLPGSPAIQNILPTRYLGTDAMAGATMGIIATIITVVLNVWYYSRVVKNSRAAGQGFAGLGERVFTKNFGEGKTKELKDISTGGFFMALLPLILVVILLNVFKVDIIFSLAIGVIVLIAFYWANLKNKISTLSVGAANSILPLLNTSAIVGFGSLVAASAGFKVISGAITSMPGHPAISLAVATNLLVGLSGSASGGLAIAMDVLGKTYLDLGLSPELIHRIAAISASGMDTLPHNGWVISTLTVAGMTHKEGYKHMFASSVVIPLVATVVAVLYALMMA